MYLRRGRTTVDFTRRKGEDGSIVPYHLLVAASHNLFFVPVHLKSAHGRKPAGARTATVQGSSCVRTLRSLVSIVNKDIRTTVDVSPKGRHQIGRTTRGFGTKTDFVSTITTTSTYKFDLYLCSLQSIVRLQHSSSSSLR